MDAQSLVTNKINELREKGLDEEILGGYIADALELAFVKTLSTKVDKLTEDKYNKIVGAIESDKVDEAISLLSEDTDDFDEQFFCLHLKEALEIK